MKTLATNPSWKPLNHAPIFLHCFSRGGSNILWNVFLSHSDVCSPIEETVQIFGAGLRHRTLEGYAVALLSGQLGLFNQWNLNERRPVPQNVQALIDRTLFKWKMQTLQDQEMKYKTEQETYTNREVQNARLAAKNNNGLIFLTDVLLKMYPDATFFGMVRHPLALYEGHKRHKLSGSPEQFVQFYEKMTAKMIRDESRFSCYHILRFEDLLQHPGAVIKKVYAQANLDFSKIEKVRFKAKPHLQADGSRTSIFPEGRHFWFEMEQVGKILEPNINLYQTGRIDPAEQDLILNRTEASLKHFGYV